MSAVKCVGYLRLGNARVKTRMAGVSVKSVVLALSMLLVGCVAGGESGAPELTEDVAADLSARAMAIACEQLCVGSEVPIRDLVYESAVTPLQGTPLTDAQRREMTQQFTDVRFLEDQDVPGVLEEGRVALVAGPVSATEEGMVEVEVAAESTEGVQVVTQLYRWSGEWIPTP